MRFLRILLNQIFPKEYFEIVIVRELFETSKAILIQTSDGFKAWLPKSQVKIIEQNSNVLTLKVPEWLFDLKLK
jgi:hypothetical protein